MVFDYYSVSVCAFFREIKSKKQPNFGRNGCFFDVLSHPCILYPAFLDFYAHQVIGLGFGGQFCVQYLF